jgi:hypothetical protein
MAAILPPQTVATARRYHSRFLEWLDLDDAAWAAKEHAHGTELYLWDALGVPRTDFPNNASGNYTKKMTDIRTLLSTHDWIRRKAVDVADGLLMQKVSCTYCWERGMRGTMRASATAANVHAAGTAHMLAVDSFQKERAAAAAFSSAAGRTMAEATAAAVAAAASSPAFGVGASSSAVAASGVASGAGGSLGAAGRAA